MRVTWTDGLVIGRHGNIAVRTYQPESESRRPPLVWLHGGAFSGGGLDQLESHAVAIGIAECGRTVVTVDYRRVPAWSWWRAPRSGDLPGARYPIPLDDVTDACSQIRAQTDGPVYLGGASAGACLAAAAALRMIRNDGEAPRGLALAYGTFHAALPSVPENIRKRIRGRHGLIQFRRGTVNKMNRNYAGSLSAMGNPFAFPGGHDLHGLPPTLVIDADRDSLRASGECFAQELTDSGARTTTYVVPESSHGFLDRPKAPAFKIGIREITGWLDSQDVRELSL